MEVLMTMYVSINFRTAAHLGQCPLPLGGVEAHRVPELGQDKHPRRSRDIHNSVIEI